MKNKKVIIVVGLIVLLAGAAVTWRAVTYFTQQQEYGQPLRSEADITPRLQGIEDEQAAADAKAIFDTLSRQHRSVQNLTKSAEKLGDVAKKLEEASALVDGKRERGAGSGDQATS